jgi:hypothetical protein
VKVLDEFSVPKYTQVRIGIANLLCVPTTKIIPGATFPPQTPTDLSLVCFPINSTPFFRVVFDQNQFGQGPVLPTPKAEQLCLPSTLQVSVTPGP